ncbi:hypothetical protein L7G72_16690 [Xenorhabdus bovienii]|uniref:hypothetical protein n=1 Tax=Xenorhabdus bovienii TaxID=40576 RepID=UPI001EE0DA45|nr:hypothetical protein [Xenorhabdus bovienii]MCG3463441.1 hypothetical protein [Xenorhabdus bovienii]
MHFVIKNIKYFSNYNPEPGELPEKAIEVELNVFISENSRNDFTAWIELPYSKDLSFDELKSKVVEVVKEKFKTASAQI